MTRSSALAALGLKATFDVPKLKARILTTAANLIFVNEQRLVLRLAD